MKKVTLSFDNGPDPQVTPKILDILARRGIKTTFFVLGDNISSPANRRIAARARDEGHWIGNHTRSHAAPLGTLDARASVAEIVDTQNAIGDLAHPRKLFRPVGGGGALGPHLLSPAAYDHLVAEAFTCVLWNVIPNDFSAEATWVERALEQCAALDEPVVVLHDVPGAAIGRLEEFLDLVAERGDAIRQNIPADAIIIEQGTATERALDYVTRPAVA